jgi:hypothetical protein
VISDGSPVTTLISSSPPTPNPVQPLRGGYDDSLCIPSPSLIINHTIARRDIFADMDRNVKQTYIGKNSVAFNLQANYID